MKKLIIIMLMAFSMTAVAQNKRIQSVPSTVGVIPVRQKMSNMDVSSPSLKSLFRLSQKEKKTIRRALINTACNMVGVNIKIPTVTVPNVSWPR